MRTRRTRLTAALASLITAAGLAGSVALATPAAAENVVTPGGFTGYGFDQCVAPTQKTMSTWLKKSPFLAVGIYISGESRGCRSQPNLTPTWVATQLDKGWRLLPITLGPQAYCHPSFPRYGDDEDINGASADGYRAAKKQGKREAVKAVAAAKALGISPGSTLWYDLEGFDLNNTGCRESALSFLSGWSSRIRNLDYISGVYSSAGSGIKMLDDARVNRPGRFHLPDQIWIARWDGVANTSTSYIRNDGWVSSRVKQYRGDHQETWGGVTINIDSNYLDVGEGSVARPETWCGEVKVDFKRYPALAPGDAGKRRTRALKCLLSEDNAYDGKTSTTYGDKLVRSINAWQSAHGFPVSSTWSRQNWIALHTQGTRPVLKIGSAGPSVRRVQRALNASTEARLPVSGVFDKSTDAALRTWQGKADTSVTGVVARPSWKRLQKGRG